MKIKDALGISVIIHGILIGLLIVSANFPTNGTDLNTNIGDSYYVDYISISSQSMSISNSSKTETKNIKESLKTLTTPKNKSSLSKLKYYDKKKKNKKTNTVVRNQKKKKIDKIISFKRKKTNLNTSDINNDDGIRMGLSSGGRGLGTRNNGVSDSVFSGYFIRFKNKISRYWHKIPSPNKQEKTMTVVRFKIFRNGKIEDVSVEKSSGNNFNDRAALRAIKSAAPFERLPYQYRLNYLLIHFEFIWE